MKDLEQQIRDLELMMALQKRKQVVPTYSDTPGLGNKLGHAPWRSMVPHPGNPTLETLLSSLMKKGLSPSMMQQIESQLLDQRINNFIARDRATQTPYDVMQERMSPNGSNLDPHMWDRYQLQNRMMWPQMYRKM